MSATQRVTRIGTLLAAFATVGAVTSSSSLRHGIARVLGIGAPGGLWRLFALLLAILNLKNMPFVWHYRIFRAMIYHLWLQPKAMTPPALFKFIITKSHTPLWETDYNLHKSNATYFTDFDVARTHLVSTILRKGIRGVGTREGEEATTWNLSSAVRRRDRKTGMSGAAASASQLGDSAPDTPPAVPQKLSRHMTEEEFMEVAKRPGNLVIALGSVACFFHREVVPYRRYEIWTRLLTWDRKWMYIVSYFVEAGACVPENYFLQPWLNRKRRSGDKGKYDGETLDQRKARLKGKVLATSIATYVIKKGRLTIPPEIVLQRSDMLPVRPPGAPTTFYTPTTQTESGTPRSEAPNGTVPGAKLSPLSLSEEPKSKPVNAASVASILEESLFPAETTAGDGEWTWAKVEAERQRGLRFAQAFDGMNELRERFDGVDGHGVLGEFADLGFGF